MKLRSHTFAFVTPSGSPHNKSSYIARFPIMGPYLQVFPSNGHGEPRKFSVVLYLTR